MLKTDKYTKLMELLSEQIKADALSLIFVQTKRQADKLRDFLNHNKLRSESLHSDRHQADREKIIEMFKGGELRIIVATDVAQRGLDIPDVRHVINFDMPANIDDYVHRIGRTGRAGMEGWALSFYNDQDSYLVTDLVELLNEVGQGVPDWLANASKEINHDRANARYRVTRNDARSFQTSSKPTDDDDDEW